MEMIDPPVGLKVVGWEPLSGPRAIKSGQNETIGGWNQGFSSPFGGWRFRLIYTPQRGAEARAFRGWVADLMGGSNVTRLPFLDPDRMIGGQFDELPSSLWSNDEPWSNGEPWAGSPPAVKVAAAASRQGTEIQLADAHWGHSLDRGSFIGFFPNHFGMYEVRRVIEPGRYLIWPWLHADIATGDDETTSYCTLDPVLAMTIESEESVTLSRGLTYMEGTSIILRQVEDYVVREYVE